MLKNIFLTAASEGGNGRADQADVLAELTGIKTQLAGVKLSLPDLISQHASLNANKATVDGQVAVLTGDKTKLVAGATLPTDLVSAGNTIAALTKENADLKAAKVTQEQAVAAEVVKLGLVQPNKTETAKAADGKAPTADEQLLAFHGVKSYAELAVKQAKTAPVAE